MTDRRRRLARAAAVALFCFSWGLAAVILVIAAAKNQLPSVANGGSIQIALACVTVGTIVIWHRPEHPMGWILSGIAVSFALDGAGAGYAALDYRDHHGTLPLGPVAVLAGQSWSLAIVLFGLAFLVYPDGGALTSRWRWVVRAYAVLGCGWIAGAWALVVLATVQHDIQVDANGGLTTGQNALWFSALSEVFFLGTGVAWLAWLGHQVITWRRSAGEYRQQLKWLIGGAAVCAASGIALVAWGTMPAAFQAIAACGVAALPVSLGIGILKFRLYDIDRIISRTLAYTIVTGLLVGLYAGLVLLATKVLAVSSPVAVAGATLVAAALFNVLRRRVQRVVDRRFNRARYDAEATVALFAARLKDTVDADSVTGDLAAVVQQALQPASLSVWLRELGSRLDSQRSELSSHLSVVTGVQAASLASSRAGSSSVITSSRWTVLTKPCRAAPSSSARSGSK
jgi:hypothetical protein